MVSTVSSALWHKNPALAQMIGLCPLLAVSNTFATATLLASCTLIVLVVAMSVISLFKTQIPTAVRLPIFVLLIAGCTTLVDIILQLVTYKFYLIVGLFIPLITTNCLLLARAESYASKQSTLSSCLDAIYMGIGFGWVMIVLGGIRELLGRGTLFASLHEVFNIWPSQWVFTLSDFYGIPLFALPPGGFITFGALLVVRNFLLQRKVQNHVKSQSTALS